MLYCMRERESLRTFPKQIKVVGLLNIRLLTFGVNAVDKSNRMQL